MDPELLLAARLATWDVVGLLVCRVFSVLVSIGIWVCLLIVVLSPPEQDCFWWNFLTLVLNLN